MLDRGQLDEFTERGFLVLPRVVPPDVLADASRAVDELIECDPPGPEMRRPYNSSLRPRESRPWPRCWPPAWRSAWPSR